MQERTTQLLASYRIRRAKQWRRRKLLISCRNSPRLNKTYFRTSKTDTSLKLIRSAGNPVLRRSKDNEEIRPLSANRNTIKAMERHGLITPGKGRDLLTIVWRLKKRIKLAPVSRA